MFSEFDLLLIQNHWGLWTKKTLFDIFSCILYMEPECCCAYALSCIIRFCITVLYINVSELLEVDYLLLFSRYQELWINKDRLFNRLSQGTFIHSENLLFIDLIKILRINQITKSHCFMTLLYSLKSLSTCQ